MANVTTSSQVDAFMQSADIIAMRTNLGLGNAAIKSVGTDDGTVAAGNDSRIVGAVQNTRLIIAGTGLTGGGSLSQDRTLSVNFGSLAGQVCAGNDPRLAATKVLYYGVGIHTIQNPFGASKPAFVDIYLCSGGGGGAGGNICSSGHSNEKRGGGGGSMGIMKYIRGFYSYPNATFEATIGSGGQGGYGAYCTSDYDYQYATGGGAGMPSALTLASALVLSCDYGLGNTGGQPNGSGSQIAPDAVTDYYVGEPWWGGVCDEWTGLAGSPTRGDTNRPFIAFPWQQSGGSGGGVSSPTGISNAGANGGNVWNTVFGVRYGEQPTFDAPINPFGIDGDIQRVYNRGYGGSGGASANLSSCKSDVDGTGASFLRAGHGSHGAVGCGGGGGGAFAFAPQEGADPILVRAGNGGNGGDGFLLMVWYNRE